MPTKRSRFEGIKITKDELPTPYAIKQTNLTFLMNAKKGVKNSKGEKTIYHLYGVPVNQMKKYILNLPKEREMALGHGIG